MLKPRLPPETRIVGNFSADRFRNVRCFIFRPNPAKSPHMRSQWRRGLLQIGRLQLLGVRAAASFRISG